MTTVRPHPGRIASTERSLALARERLAGDTTTPEERAQLSDLVALLEARLENMQRWADGGGHCCARIAHVSRMLSGIRDTLTQLSQVVALLETSVAS